MNEKPLDPKNRPFRIGIYVLYLAFAAALALLTTMGVVKGVFLNAPETPIMSPGATSAESPD